MREASEVNKPTIEETLQSIDSTLKRIEKMLIENLIDQKSAKAFGATLSNTLIRHLR